MRRGSERPQASLVEGRLLRQRLAPTERHQLRQCRPHWPPGQPGHLAQASGAQPVPMPVGFFRVIRPPPGWIETARSAPSPAGAPPRARPASWPAGARQCRTWPSGQRPDPTRPNSEAWLKAKFQPRPGHRSAATKVSEATASRGSRGRNTSSSRIVDSRAPQASHQGAREAWACAEAAGRPGSGAWCSRSACLHEALGLLCGPRSEAILQRQALNVCPHLNAERAEAKGLAAGIWARPGSTRQARCAGWG